MQTFYRGPEINSKNLKYAYASDTFNEKILFQNQSANEGYSNNKIYLGKLNHISVSKSNDKAQIYNNLIRYNSFNIDNIFKNIRTGSTSINLTTATKN